MGNALTEGIQDLLDSCVLIPKLGDYLASLNNCCSVFTEVLYTKKTVSILGYICKYLQIMKLVVVLSFQLIIIIKKNKIAFFKYVIIQNIVLI